MTEDLGHVSYCRPWPTQLAGRGSHGQSWTTRFSMVTVCDSATLWSCSNTRPIWTTRPACGRGPRIPSVLGPHCPIGGPGQYHPSVVLGHASHLWSWMDHTTCLRSWTTMPVGGLWATRPFCGTARLWSWTTRPVCGRGPHCPSVVLYRPIRRWSVDHTTLLWS